MRAGLLLACIAMVATAAAATDSALSIKRSIYVERESDGGVSLEPAETLKAGDRIVTVMQWDADDAPRKFTLASEIPPTIAYQRSSREALEVSVDGGRTWGQLEMMRVGERQAWPEDVTNLRWQVAARDTDTAVSYSAVVR
ncbi:hypothetical protein [Qipengyuania sp. DGS5-3]|uniref:hypothetical protein n=1 Tax=Qipengyuania sp. DGS5-3 TaxID=3349632 RepID=UPI0036D24F00